MYSEDDDFAQEEINSPREETLSERGARAAHFQNNNTRNKQAVYQQSQNLYYAGNTSNGI